VPDSFFAPAFADPDRCTPFIALGNKFSSYSDESRGVSPRSISLSGGGYAAIGFSLLSRLRAGFGHRISVGGKPLNSIL
jgi:hypothetical protein